MFPEDDIEAKAEADRQAVIRAMHDHGLGLKEIGEGISALAHSEDEDIKSRGLRMAIEIMALTPSRVQKHRVQSEQRILSVRFDGKPNQLGIDEGLLRRLPREQRQKAIEVMAAIKAIAPEDGAEVPNGGS